MLGGINLYILYTIFPQILDVFVPLNESRSREHPFQAEFFIDNEKYFYLIRLQMYIMIVLALEVVLAHGTMFVMYAQHVSGMFVVLGYRFSLNFVFIFYLKKSTNYYIQLLFFAHLIQFVIRFFVLL